MTQLLYGAGLRLMELFRLRVQDIDFDAGLLLIRAAKGDKDRSTILPVGIRDALRQPLSKGPEVDAGQGGFYFPGL